MKNDAEKIDTLKAYLEKIFDAFESRPLMLGTPYEVNAIFFYLDSIDLITKGYDSENYFEFSWAEFLIEKKFIVGANDMLREKLKNDEHDFSLLHALRREFLEWRLKKIGV
jgi:hypothetical protein